MRRFSDWFVYRSDYLTLAVTTVFSLVLIFSNDDPRLQTVRAFTFGGFGYLLDKATALQRHDNLYRDNQWLRQENARLMLENTQFKEANYENRRLRSMLAFRAKSRLELLPANVIGKNFNGFIRVIILDIGENIGVEKNMAVVTSQGLVGKIYQTSAEFSTAQVLLDKNFRASSMVQRSRVAGIIQWLDDNNVVLAQVPKRSDLKVGDAVVTSGLSIIFPGGLQVGIIEQTDSQEQGMFMNISVKPAVDFSKLEEVFVVKMKPKMHADSTKDVN